MKRSVFTLLFGVVAVASLAGCNGNGNSGSGNSGGNGNSGDAQPFRDVWRTVVNQPFTTFDSEGGALITSLQVGGIGSDNYNNRGDIIVLYADTPNIQVEIRKFTMAPNEDLADEDFDKLALWAATSSPSGAGVPPDAEDDCVDPDGNAQWPDGCELRIYYDGQTQVARSGADIRVTLPNDFIYDLVIETEDNDADADYQNRSDVCVENLPGSTDINLSNGVASVILDPSMSEMPECPAADVATCQAGGWVNEECPCLMQNFSFSQTRIESNDATSADAIVDIPGTGTFWGGFIMRNEGMGFTPNGGDSPGELCVANIDASVGAVSFGEGIDPAQTPWNVQGSINYPGEPATAGAGYNITTVSKLCSDVQGTETPEGFVGRNNGSDQDSTERGNLTVCSGCLRAQSCNDIVPGV